MRHRNNWLAGMALVSVIALMGAACSSKTKSPGGGSTSACSKDQFGCVTVKAGDPIHFGAIQTITASTAFLGTDEVHGINLAMDYLDGTFDGKNGQLLGHPVSLTTQDETDPTSGQCGKAGGQTAATKLAADSTVVAVIGTSCSSAALGVADTILGNKGVLLVSASATSAKLTNSQFRNPFFFRTAQNDAIQAKVVADFVFKKLGVKSAATMNDGGPYTSGLTTGFETFYKALGGAITSSESFDPTLKDFKPLLTTIAQAKPGVIYAPDFDPPCALIAIQMAQIPTLAGVKYVGSDGCNETNFYKLGKSAATASYVYLSSPKASPGSTSALFTQEQAAYVTQYGKPTASFNANGFDAFNIIAQAIKAVAIKQSDGTLLIPRTALRDAMYNIQSYQGITGSLTCIKTGDCQSQAAVNIAVYLGKDGPFAPGVTNATPFFSETFNLTEALAGLSG
jgi:branched-chain amino acid transport system substrate-binding protein